MCPTSCGEVCYNENREWCRRYGYPWYGVHHRSVTGVLSGARSADTAPDILGAVYIRPPREHRVARIGGLELGKELTTSFRRQKRIQPGALRRDPFRIEGREGICQFGRGA